MAKSKYGPKKGMVKKKGKSKRKHKKSKGKGKKRMMVYRTPKVRVHHMKRVGRRKRPALQIQIGMGRLGNRFNKMRRQAYALGTRAVKYAPRIRAAYRAAMM